MSKTDKIKLCFVFALICAVLLLFGIYGIGIPKPAYADMGPKPSVTVNFTNFPNGEKCYGTLLSKTQSTGPFSVWDGDEETKYNYGFYSEPDDQAAWQAFVDYSDPDGYFYLQMMSCVSKTMTIEWTYYPPYDFKILLYFPDRGIFISSDKTERYAFHSYFTVDMSSGQLSANAETEQLKPTRSYDYTWEIVSLLVRIIATIAIELGIALLFGYRKKFQILTVLITNCVTQIALNITLNVLAHYHGGLTVFFAYIPLELAVFAVEAVVYALTFKSFNDKITALYTSKQNAVVNSTAFSTLYAFAANGASFLAGFILALFVPGLF